MCEYWVQLVIVSAACTAWFTASRPQSVGHRAGQPVSRFTHSLSLSLSLSMSVFLLLYVVACWQSVSDLWCLTAPHFKLNVRPSWFLSFFDILYNFFNVKFGPNLKNCEHFYAYTRINFRGTLFDRIITVSDDNCRFDSPCVVRMSAQQRR